MGGGGFLFNVGLLGPCKSMPRSAKDVAKHAKVGRGRCQACLGRCKACLHILGTHNSNYLISFSGRKIIMGAVYLRGLFFSHTKNYFERRGLKRIEMGMGRHSLE